MKCRLFYYLTEGVEKNVIISKRKSLHRLSLRERWGQTDRQTDGRIDRRTDRERKREKKKLKDSKTN